MNKKLNKKSGKTNNIIMFVSAAIVILVVILLYYYQNKEDYSDSDCNPPFKKYRKYNFWNSLIYGYNGKCMSMGKKAGWCCK
jgi:hypothetical protein